MFTIKRNVVRAYIYTPDEKKVLLVKSYIATFYSLPGGAIEKYESEIDALMKELREELGIKPHDIKKISRVESMYCKKRFFFMPLESTIAYFRVTLAQEVRLKYNLEIRTHTWAEKKEMQFLLKNYLVQPF